MTSKWIRMNLMVPRLSSVLISLAIALTGCAQTGGGSATRPDSPSKAVKIGPGMNANGEVIDASKVESGYGRTLKGINDYEGEITGVPAPDSKFTQLQI